LFGIGSSSTNFFVYPKKPWLEARKRHKVGRKGGSTVKGRKEKKRKEASRKGKWHQGREKQLLEATVIGVGGSNTNFIVLSEKTSAGREEALGSLQERKKLCKRGEKKRRLRKHWEWQKVGREGKNNHRKPLSLS